MTELLEHPHPHIGLLFYQDWTTLSPDAGIPKTVYFIFAKFEIKVFVNEYAQCTLINLGHQPKSKPHINLSVERKVHNTNTTKLESN